MQKPNDPLNNLRIAAPCDMAWESMAGDERVRHCTLCSLNVYNFAEMTRDEIRALLLRTEGRVCGRLYRRADGTLLTSDCPTGLRALDAGGNNPIPGVTVTLRDEAAPHRQITVITDADGAFSMTSLNDGLYSLEVTLEGLKPAVVEHLALERNEITHARVTMRFDSNVETITVGAIAAEPPPGVSTTFSQSLINKLPI